MLIVPPVHVIMMPDQATPFTMGDSRGLVVWPLFGSQSNAKMFLDAARADGKIQHAVAVFE